MPRNDNSVRLGDLECLLQPGSRCVRSDAFSHQSDEAHSGLIPQGDDMSNTNRIPPSRGFSDKRMKVKDGRPVSERKGARSGWGQRESVVKPSIAVQGDTGDLVSFHWSMVYPQSSIASRVLLS